MPTCICGTQLEGRRRKCDACKAGPRKTGPADPPVNPVQADTTPAGLHDRGRQLWADLGLNLSTPAGQLALEACRLADRLDELDSVIAGKGVLRLLQFRLHPDWWDHDGDQHVHVEVGFQSVLAEARQQQSTFRALLADIAGKVTAVPTLAPKAVATTPLDQLAQRRQVKKAK